MLEGTVALALDWVIGANGLSPSARYNNRILEWENFDHNGQTEKDLIKMWLANNRRHLKSLCRRTMPGDGRSFDYSGVAVSSQFNNDKVHWISEYKASATIAPVHPIIAVERDEYRGCCCQYSVTLLLMASDIADFNPGGRFGPFGLVRDDWFIWIRDHTPFGYDYTELATKTVFITWKDCF